MPISGGTFIFVIVLASIFSLTLLMFCYQIANRLSGIEECMEKIAILMAATASKQGITQDDVVTVTTGEVPDKKKAKK